MEIDNAVEEMENLIREEYSSLSLMEDLFSSALEDHFDDGAIDEDEYVELMKQHRKALNDMKKRIRKIAPFKVSGAQVLKKRSREGDSQEVKERSGRTLSKRPKI